MDPVEVRVRDCACPETPHAETGDLVYLNPRLSASGGVAAEIEIGEGNVNLTQRLLMAFARNETVGWNLLDDKGKPIPFSRDDLLADWTLARLAVAKCGELYTDTAIAPFQTKPAERSRTGRTPATTSRTPAQTPSPSA